MKKIIGNKLYDTEKANIIYSFLQRRKCASIGDVNFYNMYNVDVYKTEKGNYFIHGYIKDKPSYEHFLEEIAESELKEIVKKLNADLYMTLFNNDEIEEA